MSARSYVTPANVRRLSMQAVEKRFLAVLVLLSIGMTGCASLSPDLSSTAAPGPAPVQTVTSRETEKTEAPVSSAPQEPKKAPQKKTIENLTRAVELAPSHAPAYNELGFAYAKKGDYDKAIANYNKALELDRCYDWALYNRGCAWDEQGKYDLAIADYGKALQCNPRYAEAYNNRGNAWYRKERYDEAFQDYTKAVELAPRYAIAHYNLGNAWSKKGRYREAVAEFTTAVQLKPDYSAAYNNRGVVHIMLEQYAEAEKDLMAALELDPDEGSTMVRLAELYSVKKDIVEACRWLERGVDKGYRDFKYIKKAVTLDNIRKWPCYDSALSRK